jgi:hypothetical protein
VVLIIIPILFLFIILQFNTYNASAAPSQASIELDYYFAEGVNRPGSDYMIQIPGTITVDSIGVGPNVQQIEVDLNAHTNIGWRAGVTPSYFLFEPPEYYKDRFNVMITLPYEAPASDAGLVNVSGTATTYQTSFVSYIEPVEARIKNRPFMICESSLDWVFSRALPGESLDMLLKIENLGNFDDKFIYGLSSNSYKVFPQLTVTFQEDEINIPKKSFYEVKLSIDIPGDAKAGSYDLTFEIANIGINEPESIVLETVGFQITVERQGIFGIGNLTWFIVIIIIVGTIIFGLLRRRKKKIIVRRVK